MEDLGMTTPKEVKPHFWRGKRVLITGHTGFKGSWLSLWLQSMGATLRGVALPPPTTPSLFEVAQLSNYMEHRIIDIRDYVALKAEFDDFQPEIIIHMAAQALVRLSYSEPVETYATNVLGTAHVLEAARHLRSLKAIVNVTTDKCYENQEWSWGYRENDTLGGHDPYSSSKACAELVSAAYRNSFLKAAGIAMATVRAGNVIGGGDWARDRLVPDALRALQANEPILIRNPDAIRPWQHVLEPLRGYLLLAERLFTNGSLDAEAWNFGPRDEDAKPVKWVVEHLCRAWGRDASWHIQPGQHPHEAHFLKLDTSKVRQRLNWHPQMSLQSALSYICEWHRAWLGGQDAREISLNQIQRFATNNASQSH